MYKFLSLLATNLLLFSTISSAQNIGGAILDGLFRGITSPSSSSSASPKDNVAIIDAKELFPEVSRIELKVIQTRKFKKAPNEIFAGIKSLCADKSGQFGGILPVYKGVGKPIGMNNKVSIANTEEVKYEKYELATNYGPLVCIRKTGIGGGQFLISNNPRDRYRYAILKYELEWNPADTSETIVRMRINWSTIQVAGHGDSDQTTALMFYQANFKELADGMFIDAIQLTPAEMQ